MKIGMASSAIMAAYITNTVLLAFNAIT